MKINIHYLFRYVKFINNFKDQYDFHYEYHHILPKCLGGDNSSSNLVRLSPRAHFIAHCILHRAYPENRKVAHAFAMMATNNKHQSRNISGKMYEKARIARSIALKGVPQKSTPRPKSNTENYKGNKNANPEKSRESLKKLWKEHPDNALKVAAMRRKNGTYGTKISCEGVIFASILEARIHYKKGPKWIRRRLQSKEFPAFIYL